MTSLRIDGKGRLRIPKDVRERLKIKPGQKLTVIEKGGIVRLVPIRHLKLTKALRWAAEESGIDSKDPIFDIALGRRKPVAVRLKGEALRRARKASGEVDEAVYDEE